MPRFFATCPRGIESSLREELIELGAKGVVSGTAGVSFEGSWKTCYMANLQVRSASRVLYPVLDFPAYEPDHIYHNVLKHDWTKYINVNQTIAVDSNVRDSKIQDLRIVSLKAKDAVVDQFREKFGSRPNVDTEKTDLQISVRLARNACTVSLDTSGGSLHERGYRKFTGQAPIKENLAAGLLRLAQWDPKTEALLDPTCGSGTFCLEGGLRALNIGPGTLKERFGFQKWKTYQSDAFDECLSTCHEQELIQLPRPIFGFDKDQRVIAAAEKNSKLSALHNLVKFKHQALKDLEGPPVDGPGLIIANPPYGERLSEIEELKDLYSFLGRLYRTKFKGWRMAVLTSERSLMDCLDLKPAKSYRVFNGSIPCFFEIFHN
ncbi:MAG: RNA methyltransferase [Oligoflexia bacterium]|nr:RNA methyltransferase [Oligoflexia bacterium]